MKSFRPFVLGALMAVLSTAAHGVPISLTQSPGGPNITSSGNVFTHTVALSEIFDNAQALLSLSFKVSKNDGAQNDSISLFLGGILLTSGHAGSFEVIDLDVTEFFDFTTGTVSFELRRNVAVGGGGKKGGIGSIQLHSAVLKMSEVGSGGQGSSGHASQPEQSVLFPISEGSIVPQQTEVFSVPEPGTLALLGLGILGMAGLRRRATRDEVEHP